NEDGGPATGDVTDAGDSDPDGTALTVNTTPVSGPSNGSITINADGTYSYTPNANFNGTDVITVEVCDNGTPLPAQCVNQTITITVNPVNDPPVANNNTTSTNEDTPVTVNVSSNDTDIDGTIDPATVDLDPTTPGQQTTLTTAEGTWTVDASGNVTFTPAANFNGTATATYTVNDNSGATSNTATITVTVNPVNDPPVVDYDVNTINEDGGPATGDVTDAGDSDPDGTALTVNTTPVSGPSNGTITINADGTYSYTPTANFYGTDVITVEVCDNGTPLPAQCVNQTITITVNPVNDPPVANDNATSTNEDTPVIVNVSSNDTDIDGTIDAATVDLDPSTPGQQTTLTTAEGTWTVNASGDVTFTPAGNFNGTATATYT
ncbi:MAG: tandem-95 repeat protein, partial [Bacteroidota bacterium]